MSKETAVEMFVGGLVLDPNTQAPVVILKDETGQVTLPIWIGIAEATSIASAIKQLNMARPLTHDLMYDIFVELGMKIERVMITELKDSTYFAELVLSFGDKVLLFDSRPSDAIALAIRATAPIFVAQQVLDQAKLVFPSNPPRGEPLPDPAEGQTGEAANTNQPPQGSDFTNIDKDKWTEILNNLDPDDFKYKM